MDKKRNVLNRTEKSANNAREQNNEGKDSQAASVKLLDYNALFGAPPRKPVSQRAIVKPQETEDPKIDVGEDEKPTTSLPEAASTDKTIQKQQSAQDENEDISDDSESSVSSQADEDENEMNQSDVVSQTSSHKTSAIETKRRELVLLKRLRNNVHRQAKLAKKFEIRKVIRQIQKAKESPSNEAKIAKLDERLKQVKQVDISLLESQALILAERQHKPTESANNSAPEAVDAITKVILDYPNLKSAALEYYARPEREHQHRERAKRAKLIAEKKEKEKLKRLENPLLCGFRMCKARFANEKDLEVHRMKRHNTTGDLERDMEMGLRTKPPSANEKKAFKLMKEGGSLEEINELLTSWKEKQEMKKQKQREEFKEHLLKDIEAGGDAGAGVSFKNRPSVKEKFGPQRESNGKRPGYNDDESNSKRHQLADDIGRSDHDRTVTRKEPRTRMPSDKTWSEQANHKSDEKLHPSWEAKKSQASKIVPFQGKVVSFDDDD